MSPATAVPREPLAIAVIANDLNAVRSLHTNDPETYNLSQIADLACKYEQLQILSWTFNQGLLLNNDPINHRLFNAILASQKAPGHKHSIPIISTLISHGFDLKQWREYYGDLLSAAAHQGDLPLAKLLLENGIDPNSDHIEGTLDFIFDGQCATNEMLRLLLDHGFEPRGTPEALIVAAQLGNIEAMQWLVEAGADLEAMPDFEGTALYMACKFGKVEAVKWLLEMGADPRSVAEMGGSCGHVATEGGFEDVVELLRARMKETA